LHLDERPTWRRQCRGELQAIGRKLLARGPDLLFRKCDYRRLPEKSRGSKLGDTW
jgi:hypothetical protein